MKYLVVGVVALSALYPGFCRAETLFDAIQMAYQTNPAMAAQRSALNAINEGYVQARAGYGPQVNFSGQFGYQNAEVQGGNFLSSEASNYQASTGSADLQVVQPIFASGEIAARVNGAAASVQGGRQDLRLAESELLQKVITAYADVLRDRASVEVIRKEVAILADDLNEARAKQALGALSKTDVAQAQARLLSAQAQLNLTRARMNISSGEYLSVVGQSPGELAPVPDLPGMPSSVEQAFEAAEGNNPRILALIAAEKTAQAKVEQAKAANGPKISMRLDATVSPVEPYLPKQYDRSVTVAVTLDLPLFTSGLNTSRVRETLDDDNRAELNIAAAKRDAVQLVSRAWDELQSRREDLAIQQRQLAAEDQAVTGSRIEQRAGVRPIIDLLNAEAELSGAQIAIIQSRHDEYLAEASLLSVMGLLEVRLLNPAASLYDPAAPLRKVEHIGAAPWENAIAAVDGLAARAPAAPVSPQAP